MKGLAKFAPLIFLGLVSLGCLWGIEKDHDPDQVMIERFNAHRAEFERLLGMFQEDKSLGRVGPDFTRTSNFYGECNTANCWHGEKIEVTDARLREYRRMFRDLGLSAGIEGYNEKESISFIANTQGALGGTAKGYAYLQTKPDVLVDDLGTDRTRGIKPAVSYRHIDGKWYLYLEYDD